MAVLLAGCAGTGGTGTGGAGTGGAGTGGPASPVPSAVVVPSSPAAAHSLVITAEGDAEIISIVYELDGETSTEGPASLPWRKTVEVPADGRPHRWSLTLTHGSGRATLVATFDGAPAGRSQGAGTGQGTLRVSGSVDA
ncbi:hypothetical protein JCM9534A_69410 [Catenuloplanes indicus JCM 9534]